MYIVEPNNVNSEPYRITLSVGEYVWSNQATKLVIPNSINGQSIFVEILLFSAAVTFACPANIPRNSINHADCNNVFIMLHFLPAYVQIVLAKP